MLTRKEPFAHSDDKDEKLYITVLDECKMTVAFERVGMTNFIKAHLDLLEPYEASFHISICERSMPTVSFIILYDDEWEKQKAKFISIGYVPEDVKGGPHKFTIEGRHFDVNYNVVRGSVEGTTSLGSHALPLLLTNTYVSPGVYTYAHVKRSPKEQ